MPPESRKQRRLMQAVKHDPVVAKRTGISREVAKRVLGEGEGHGSRKPYKASGPEPTGRYRKD